MENAVEVGPLPSSGPATRLSSARAALLALIVDGGQPVTVKQLAATSGQHLNTVREHLEALAEFGMLRRETAPPAGRGRPAVVYAVTDEAPLHGMREYASLVDALAGHLRRMAVDPQAEAIEAGRAWAHSLPEGAGTHEVLDQMGFKPVPEPGGVRLTECPLLAAARRNPDIVCQVHLGLLKEIAGEDVELEPFVPGGCRVHLPLAD